jgi:hypothetical protein
MEPRVGGVAGRVPGLVSVRPPGRSARALGDRAGPAPSRRRRADLGPGPGHGADPADARDAAPRRRRVVRRSPERLGGMGATPKPPAGSRSSRPAPTARGSRCRGWFPVLSVTLSSVRRGPSSRCRRTSSTAWRRATWRRSGCTSGWSPSASRRRLHRSADPGDDPFSAGARPADANVDPRSSETAPRCGDRRAASVAARRAIGFAHRARPTVAVFCSERPWSVETAVLLDETRR